MQKFIGCVLILSATTGGGILYGAELKQYLEKLFYLRHVIYLLKGELEYSHASLGEIFSRLSTKVKPPYCLWFRRMEKQIWERKEEDFFQIWTLSIETDLKKLQLKKTHIAQLNDIGNFLGQLDQIAAVKALELYLNRLGMEIEKEREHLEVRKRISSWLGVMGGLFLVVILM